MLKQLAHANEMDWTPLVEEGIKTDGLYVKTLRYDTDTKRPLSFLLKFEPNSSYPFHNHPAGEEVFVLEGEVRFGTDKLQKGDYLYTPPNGKHAAFSKRGAIILLIVPEEVEILEIKS